MKQLNFLDLASHNRSLQSSDIHYWKLFIDGAARNNPGPAGIGMVIFKDEDLVEQQGFFVGSKTNNQAEYLALLLGLIRIKQLVGTDDLLLILSDSELLVRQLKGRYKVKNPALKSLYEGAQRLLNGLKYDIGHILRYKNESADALANRGIDQKIAVPQYFITVLHDYGISL
ncbi:ribonuclease HI family protein [Candidatus Dependentiae bacterium]|nr:MAG: ribonuclease HI family protein [Candidatus Dependentiae bacterium]